MPFEVISCVCYLYFWKYFLTFVTVLSVPIIHEHGDYCTSLAWQALFYEFCYCSLLWPPHEVCMVFMCIILCSYCKMCQFVLIWGYILLLYVYVTKFLIVFVPQESALCNAGVQFVCGEACESYLSRGAWQNCCSPEYGFRYFDLGGINTAWSTQSSQRRRESTTSGTC